IVAVALDLVAQRADHLRMAIVATLAHVDVATGELERRIGPHAVGLLNGAVEIEQRRDLDETTDRDDDQHPDNEQDRVLLQGRLQRHAALLTRPARTPAPAYGEVRPRPPRPKSFSRCSTPSAGRPPGTRR